MKLNEILGFVKIVLEKRFPGSNEKQKIEGDFDRKINFACPICGDSEKKSSKKRGNLYLDTGAYKCFNDGCMAYMPVAEFVSTMCRQYGILMPSFIIETDAKPLEVKRQANQLARFMLSDKSDLITITDVINRFSLRRMDDVPETSRAYQYVKSRNLTQIGDFGDVLYADHSDNKVYIFNFEHSSGRLLGFSIRSLDPNAERKYIIKTYSDLVQIFSQKNLSKEIVADANFLNNYFNVMNVNLNFPVCMTEGQFDSMFVYNCIATSGVSKAHSILQSLGAKGSIRILFDRDKAGKNQMMNLIKQGYSVFLWNKAMNDLKKLYSSPDDFYKIQDIKDTNDLFSFLFARLENYSINDFNLWIGQHFSTSQFDLMYL
jgi:hypothetical protein